MQRVILYVCQEPDIGDGADNVQVRGEYLGLYVVISIADLSSCGVYPRAVGASVRHA
jgi:hypothetical protein